MNNWKIKGKKEDENLGYPLSPDRTAIEKHYSRSKRIRLAVYRYLVEISANNKSFEDRSELANQCANPAKCSYETALRWINQFTSTTGDFYFFQDEHRLAWRRGGQS